MDAQTQTQTQTKKKLSKLIPRVEEQLQAKKTPLSRHAKRLHEFGEQARYIRDGWKSFSDSIISHRIPTELDLKIIAQLGYEHAKCAENIMFQIAHNLDHIQKSITQCDEFLLSRVVGARPHAPLADPSAPLAVAAGVTMPTSDVGAGGRGGHPPLLLRVPETVLSEAEKKKRARMETLPITRLYE